MQHDGLFMVGGNFLPKAMTPAVWDYHTGNYFLNITFLPFVEVGYRCTLFKGDFKAGNHWQQDRSVSLRLRAVKEGRLFPSVVVGSNDLLTTNVLNVLQDTKGNRFFSSVYTVATKNIRFGGGHVCGLTFGSYFFAKNSLYQGVFGGVKYTPAFLKSVSVVAEYEKNGINAGLTARLFGHFSAHAFVYDFKTVSCGLRYECLLK